MNMNRITVLTLACALSIGAASIAIGDGANTTHSGAGQAAAAKSMGHATTMKTLRGEIVDTDLRTEVDNLFVCDASVLPLAPGLPPILTILALARRLGKRLS